MIWVLIIGFMVLSWAVGARLKGKFRKYSRIPLRNGMSGAEAAYQMLRDHGIYDVDITCVPGELTDHYNPSNKTVNLSEEVYYGRNAAAVAVATHECGHAVQHAEAYGMLEFRSAMVPAQAVAGKIMNIIFMMSIFGGLALLALPPQMVLLVVVGCYTVITLFSLVTLPVEFDASKRALAWISQSRIATSEEQRMAKDALHWAAMTYVVAALSSLSMLAYYIFSLLGSSDD